MRLGGQVGGLRDGGLVVAAQPGGVGLVGFGDEEDGAEGGDEAVGWFGCGCGGGGRWEGDCLVLLGGVRARF